MSVLALSLVLITVATAGGFSRIPENHPREDYVIVKEGHRVVVVEYEKDDKNTKISIFPQEIDGKLTNFKDKSPENTEDAKEKINEKGSHHRSSSIKESARDAQARVGKFVKDTFLDFFMTAQLAKDKVIENMAKALVEGADKYNPHGKKNYGPEGDRISKSEEEAKNHEAEIQKHVSTTIQDSRKKAGKAVESASEKVTDSAQRVKDDGEKVKNRQAEPEIEKNVSTTKEKIQDSTKKQVMESASEKVKDSAQRVKDDGEKDLNRFLSWDWGIFANISESTAPVMGILSLLGLATAYGMGMWVTFVSSFVLAGALPRQQSAMVQSKINRVYFKAMTCSLGLALLGHVLSGAKRLSSMRQEIVQGFNLVAPLLTTLVNFLYLEPRSSKVMLERMKEEKEEGREKVGFTTEPSSEVIDTFTDRIDELAGKAQMLRMTGILKRLNQYSTALNVLTLMSLTWHLVNLGQHLNSVY